MTELEQLWMPHPFPVCLFLAAVAVDLVLCFDEFFRYCYFDEFFRYYSF